MADIVIGYIILGVVISLFIAALILKLVWGWKVKYPEGNKITFNYNEFKADLIVDKTIEMIGDDFIFDNKKMNKTTLAKMCAMSMEAVDYTAKKYGPEQLRRKTKLTNCVFVFLPEDKYYKELKNQYGSKTPSAGFSSTLVHNMGQKIGPHVCYMSVKYMWEVYTTGYLSVHEYTHCYSHEVNGDWDPYHKIWEYKTINGKTMQFIAVERIKNKLTLDKKLQN